MRRKNRNPEIVTVIRLPDDTTIPIVIQATKRAGLYRAVSINGKDVSGLRTIDLCDYVTIKADPVRRDDTQAESISAFGRNTLPHLGKPPALVLTGQEAPAVRKA